MREKNTTVGGLYSMFVKGDTMGGTLGPAAAPTAGSGKFNWKREIKRTLREVCLYTWPTPHLHAYTSCINHSLRASVALCPGMWERVAITGYYAYMCTHAGAW